MYYQDGDCSKDVSCNCLRGVLPERLMGVACVNKQL